MRKQREISNLIESFINFKLFFITFLRNRIAEISFFIESILCQIDFFVNLKMHSMVLNDSSTQTLKVYKFIWNLFGIKSDF
jgi:hypothetical protein